MDQSFAASDGGCIGPTRLSRQCAGRDAIAAKTPSWQTQSLEETLLQATSGQRPPIPENRLPSHQYEAAGNPVFSIDTKKKELLGNLFRAGDTYTQETMETLDHDFPAYASGVIHPHALYDVLRNHGHINLGISNDTSEFACDSVAFAWEHYGLPHYPKSTSLLLLCDGGGSNASNRYVFKYALEKLADRLNLEIRVAHYPPYKSKFNPIEHRFFPHVSRACQGVIFISAEIALAKMAETSTNQGLTTTVHLLKGEYPTGQKAPKDYKKTMRICFDDELPKWNYRAIPSKQGS